MDNLDNLGTTHVVLYREVVLSSVFRNVLDECWKPQCVSFIGIKRRKEVFYCGVYVSEVSNPTRQQQDVEPHRQSTLRATY